MSSENDDSSWSHELWAFLFGTFMFFQLFLPLCICWVRGEDTGEFWKYSLTSWIGCRSDDGEKKLNDLPRKWEEERQERERQKSKLIGTWIAAEYKPPAETKRIAALMGTAAPRDVSVDTTVTGTLTYYDDGRYEAALQTIENLRGGGTSQRLHYMWRMSGTWSLGIRGGRLTETTHDIDIEPLDSATAAAFSASGLTPEAISGVARGVATDMKIVELTGTKLALEIEEVGLRMSYTKAR